MLGELKPEGPKQHAAVPGRAAPAESGAGMDQRLPLAKAGCVWNVNLDPEPTDPPTF